MYNSRSNDRNAIDGVKLSGGKGPDKKGGGVGSSLPNIKADTGLDRSNSSIAAMAANDSFNKHYNKELKVSEGKYREV